jgi:hypothetical protein
LGQPLGQFIEFVVRSFSPFFGFAFSGSLVATGNRFEDYKKTGVDG